MRHDTVTVYGFQKVVLPHLKQLLPELKKVYYFSDGSAAQYNIFANIRHHSDDFGLDCEWNFFATSHGKTHAMELEGQ